MIKVTVQDEFFHKTLTGIFETEAEAREFYAMELDTNPEYIDIIEIQEVEG